MKIMHFSMVLCVFWTDSLQFYAWRRDTTGGYRAEGLYLAGIAGQKLDDRAVPLVVGDLQRYTVYNPTNAPIMLTIPPIPLALSAISGLRRSGTGNGWSVRVISSLDDGTALSTVYCGFSGDRSAGWS
jgi:hypothetical protein